MELGEFALVIPLLAALPALWRTAVKTGHGREDISADRLALVD